MWLIALDCEVVSLGVAVEGAAGIALVEVEFGELFQLRGELNIHSCKNRCRAVSLRFRLHNKGSKTAKARLHGITDGAREAYAMVGYDIVVEHL